MVSKYDRGFDDIQVLILAILLFVNFIKNNKSKHTVFGIYPIYQKNT